MIKDCDQHVFVYSVAIKRVANCQAFGPIQDTLDEAVQNALDYFNNEFRCEDPDCIRKVGKIVWSGWSCGGTPVDAIAAVVVEMWCTVEL